MTERNLNNYIVLKEQTDNDNDIDTDCLFL